MSNNLKTLQAMNTTITTTHNYNNEYILPNWGNKHPKVTFIDSQDGEDEDGNETYINTYRVNLTPEEANYYINHILLPYLEEIIRDRGADDDCYDYIPSLLTEAVQFIQLLGIDPKEAVLIIINYGDTYDYDLREDSEFLDLTGYLK